MITAIFNAAKREQMLQFIKTLWNICLLRGGPQDVPYSATLVTAIVTIHYCLTVFFIAWTHGISNGLGMAAMLVGVSFAAIFLVLRMRKVPERFVQTVSALFGTSIILSLMALPLLIMVATMAQMAGGSMIMLGQWVGIAVEIWILIVAGHIFRNALAIPLFVGVILSIGIALLNAIVVRAMMGGV